MSLRSAPKPTVLAAFLLALASLPNALAQVACPVALITANSTPSGIQLEFRNKGKVPIEQLSLTCNPPAHNNLPNTACYVETGIFYPGAMSWIKIDYPAANHHAIEISVARLRVAGGTLWQPGAHACKPLKLPRQN